MSNSSLQVVIYDGNCGFCTNAARWFQSRLDAPVEILPNTPDVLKRFGVTAADAARALQWVSPGGRASGAAAVAAWFATSTKLRWRLLGRFIASPPIAPIASIIYRIVARYRGHLSWMFS